MGKTYKFRNKKKKAIQPEPVSDMGYGVEAYGGNSKTEIDYIQKFDRNSYIIMILLIILILIVIGACVYGYFKGIPVKMRM